MKTPKCCSSPLAAALPPQVLRSRRERLIQTLCFEALGLVFVTPLLALFTAASAREAAGVLVVLSIAVMCWSAVYNWAFDWLEWRWTGRLASDRPHLLRFGHTLGHELSATLVSWPLIAALTPLGWIDALWADVGLTLAYVIYGYVFHLVFDRLRPVRTVRGELPTER